MDRQESANGCPDRLGPVPKACAASHDSEGSCDQGSSCQLRQYIKNPGLLWGSVAEALSQVGFCLVKTVD